MPGAGKINLEKVRVSLETSFNRVKWRAQVDVDDYGLLESSTERSGRNTYRLTGAIVPTDGSDGRRQDGRIRCDNRRAIGKHRLALVLAYCSCIFCSVLRSQSAQQQSA